MIHQTAVIASSARIPESCKIGPFCVIGEEVTLGENCELISHVAIHGPTKIGSGNKFYPFSLIGGDPQDFTFTGQKVFLEMGDNNIVRESVTITRGTIKGGGTTRIGNNCFIMAYSHIGHDCQVGNNVMLVNAATLAGHVIVEEHAVIGAMSPVHQFVRVGRHAYIGGGTVITQDVLPFTKTVARREVGTFGVNSIGLERKGFSKERVAAIQRAYKTIYRNNISQALEKLKAEPNPTDDVKMMIDFIEKSERGLIK